MSNQNTQQIEASEMNAPSKGFLTLLTVINGWKKLAVLLIAITILELGSILLISDSLSLLIMADPDLRLKNILPNLAFFTDHTILMYIFCIITVYGTIITLQTLYIKSAAQIGYGLSSEIFTKLKFLGYTQFCKLDKAQISAKLVPETQRTASAVITPFLNLISKILLVACILIYLAFDLGLATLLVSGAFLPYILIIIVVLKKLKTNGAKFTQLQTDRQNVIMNVFSADKYLYFNDYFEHLQDSFTKLNQKMANIFAQNTILSQLPKYIVEMMIGFSAIVFYSIHNTIELHENTLSNATILIVAMLKLLPNIQQIYRSTSMIIANVSSLFDIYKLRQQLIICSEADPVSVQHSKIIRGRKNRFELFAEPIELNGNLLRFSKVIVEPGDILAISGISGIGKTTIWENIIQLRNDLKIHPFEELGHSPKRMGSLKGCVGFLGQTAHCDRETLTATLNEQIELSTEELKLLLNSWSISKTITYFTNNSNSAFNTLSGGEKRKIGLINALLSKSEVIFLDEPTNDLDEVSKKHVLALIALIAKKKKKLIIVISHDKDLIELANKQTKLDRS